MADKNSNPTQAAQILAYLKKGHAITPLYALDMFGCFRLASRISELRLKGGHDIKRRLVKDGDKSYAEYWLNKETAISC